MPSRLLPPWLETEIALAPIVDRAAGVVGVHDALDHERARPTARAARRGRPSSGAASSSTRRRRRRRSGPARLRGAMFGTVSSGQAAVAQEVSEPAGPGERLGRELQPSSGGRAARGSSGCPSRGRWAKVQSSGHDQPSAPAASRARCSCAHPLAGAEPVDLEEGLRVRRDHLLDRLAGERAQPHRGARAPRRRGRRRPRRRDGRPARRSARSAPASRSPGPSRWSPCSRSAGRPVAIRGDSPSSPKARDVVVEGDAALGAGEQGASRRTCGSRLLRPPLGLGDRLEPVLGAGHAAIPRVRQRVRGSEDRRRAGPRRTRGARRAAGVVDAGAGRGPRRAAGERASPWPSDALGVGAVERQAGEELRRHAAAAAGVVVPAASAGARRTAARAARRNSSESRQTPREAAAARGRCRPGTRRGSRTGRRRRRRPGRSGRRPARRRRGSAPAAPRRARRGGRTSRRSAPARRAPAASRRAARCCAAVGCSSSQTSAPRPEGRSRVIRSCAP